MNFVDWARVQLLDHLTQKVKQIAANACGVAASAIEDQRTLSSLGDADTVTWFWQETERQFDIVITKAQRESLQTIAQVIHYLKIRAEVTAG